jgi:predicted nucleotidyltransferase
MRTKPTASGEVLFGAARRKILALLFGHSDQAYHLRQVVRATGLSPGGVHRELGQLAGSGIVTRTRQGRQVYFQANPASPIFAELKSLLVKTVGVADVLRAALSPLAGRIRVAFVYGSFARGEERRSSDVDVMIVGDVSPADVSDALGPPQRALGREVNPVVYPETEFRTKVAESRLFVRTVLRERKVFLLGDKHELERVAGKPLAD